MVVAESKVMSLNLTGQWKTREVVRQNERYHDCDLKTGPPKLDGRKLTNGPRTLQLLNLPYSAEWRYVVCFHYEYLIIKRTE